MKSTKTLKREDVAVEAIWDRESFYPSREIWEQDFKATMTGLSELWPRNSK